MIYSFGNNAYDLWNVVSIGRYDRKHLFRKNKYYITLEFRNRESVTMMWNDEKYRDQHYEKIMVAWEKTQQEKANSLKNKRRKGEF